MRNIEEWTPTKFIYIENRLKSNTDKKEVIIGSRLAVNLIANFYEDYIKKFAGGKLLDLGCGKVPFYHVYKNLIQENICVDWGNSLHKNPHLDIEHDLNLPLPLKSNEFDTIILSDVLEHIWKPGQLWLEMYRVLKPTGKLIMSVPYYYCLHEEPFDYFRYTQFALTRFAMESGFKVIMLKPTGGILEIMGDLLAKSATKIPFIGPTISILSQNMLMFLLRIKLVKTFSIKTAEKFPFGYFMIVEKIS